MRRSHGRGWVCPHAWCADSPFNIKGDHVSDLVMAESILRGTEWNHMRIGQGFDDMPSARATTSSWRMLRIGLPEGGLAHSDGDVSDPRTLRPVLGALGWGAISSSTFRIATPIRAAPRHRVFLS